MKREVTIRAVLARGTCHLSLVVFNIGNNVVFFPLCLHERHLTLKNLAKKFEIFLELSSHKMFTTSVRVQYWKEEKQPGIGVLGGWYSMQASKDLGCNGDQTPHSKLIAFQADHVILQAVHCTDNPIYVFMYLWTIYIFPGSVCLFGCSKIGRPILGIFNSLTDTWIW